MRLAFALSLAFVTAGLALPGICGAGIYTEAGDAGDLPSTAQVTTGPAAGDSLTSISGETNLVNGLSDSDMYEIYIDSPSTFSASTTAFVPGANNFDTQLELFTSAGVGVISNDDTSSSQQSALPAGSLTLPAGDYYLLISGSGRYAVDATNALIFPNFNDGATDPTSTVGTADANAITGYTGYSDEAGKYVIDLTGAEVVEEASVPEPSSLAALAVLATLGGLTLVRRRRSRRLLATGAAVLVATWGFASLQAGIPDNLGLGLQDLAKEYRAARSGGAKTLTHPQFAKVLAKYPRARADAKDRVLVDVYLDGSVKIDEVAKACRALGCTVNARVDWYRHGALSMYLPLAQAAKLGRLPGVNSAKLDAKPRRFVGLATSQGTTVLQSAVVNAAGYYGAGITIGALSDSFDTAKNGFNPTTTDAAQDVANGDLPGPGNPNGYLTPVYVPEDFGSDFESAGTDEGRAMLQIVSDEAPAAALAFATGNVSEVGFAQNIVLLATPKNQMVTIPASTDTVPASLSGNITVAGGGCQVICDDLGYYDEPMFSDGILSQAVDQATALGASYFSAAGNDGSSGYNATYSPQPNNATNQGLLSSEGGIAYATIPPTETAVIASYHSFGTNAQGQPILVQKVMQPLSDGSEEDGVLIFQWDDPFDVVTGNVNQVTTDYDILVFSVNATTGIATYETTRSGTASNFSTNEPIEEPEGELLAGTQYEFVIVQTNRTPGAGVTANQARHIRWAVESDACAVIADFNTPNSPESYGHPCASTANGMAAYVYDNGYNYLDDPYVPQIETYSSNGPAKIYFDSAGNRLATPLTRKQPTLAAVDGVDTSFFGADSDGDGLPNFFGTSAAAPAAAGCAGLILNAAAVHGITLTPADVRELLVSTTQGTQDLDPAQSNATAGPVTFNAVNRSTSSDPDAYTIAYTGPTGSSLQSLVFDLTPAAEDFYTGTYDVTAGQTTAPTGTAPTIASSVLSNDATGTTFTGATETLTFSNFNPGDSLSFGVAVGTAAGNIVGGDSLAGATVTFKVVNANSTISTYSGTVANVLGRRWNVKSGFGLIDVSSAIDRLLGL